MKVREVMTGEVDACQTTTNLAAAAALMWKRNVGALPAVNDQGRVIGVITDRDICMAEATRPKLAAEITVMDVISGDVYTCSPGDEVEAALAVMQLHQVRRLPVVDDDGSLQGILSLDDVVLHASKTRTIPGIAYPIVIKVLKAVSAHRDGKSQPTEIKKREGEAEPPALEGPRTESEPAREVRVKSDARLEEEILNELEWDSRVDETAIEVEVSDRIVTLTGTAPNYPAYRAAQTAAQRVAGVRDVINDLEVEVPSASARTDFELAKAARDALARDVLVAKERVTLAVIKGVITLEGSAHSLREREETEEAVYRLAGVRGVRNKITVKPARENRADLQKAIEEAIQRCAEDEAEHVKVKLTNGKVTLTGRISSEIEKRAIIETVSHAPGVKEIHDLLYLGEYDT